MRKRENTRITVIPNHSLDKEDKVFTLKRKKREFEIFEIDINETDEQKAKLKVLREKLNRQLIGPMLKGKENSKLCIINEEWENAERMNVNLEEEDGFLKKLDDINF